MGIFRAAPGSSLAEPVWPNAASMCSRNVFSCVLNGWASLVRRAAMMCGATAAKRAKASARSRWGGSRTVPGSYASWAQARSSPRWFNYIWKKARW